MKAALAGAAIALAGFSLPAAADVRLEAAAGQSHFSLWGENNWWQSYFPHQEDTRGDAYQLGAAYTVSLEHATIGARIAYVDLGRASNSATWNSDVNYNAGVKTCSPWCAESSSTWRARGLSIGPLAELELAGARIGAEAGGFIYQAGGRVQFHTTVGRELGQGINDGICEVPYTWRATPYVGASVAAGHLFVAWREYRDIETDRGEKFGLIRGHATSVMLGLAWTL